MNVNLVAIKNFPGRRLEVQVPENKVERPADDKSSLLPVPWRETLYLYLLRLID